jgi:hypothetical protein
MPQTVPAAQPETVECARQTTFPRSPLIAPLRNWDDQETIQNALIYKASRNR